MSELKRGQGEGLGEQLEQRHGGGEQGGQPAGADSWGTGGQGRARSCRVFNAKLRSSTEGELREGLAQGGAGVVRYML